MKHGFCIAKGNARLNIKKEVTGLALKIEELHDGYLFIGSESPFEKMATDDETLYLIGEINNRRLLEGIAGRYDASAWSLSNVELLHTIHLYLGTSALSLVEGSFFFFKENKKGELTLLTDPNGFMPIHVVRDQTLWITDRLKFVGHIAQDGVFDFMSEDHVIQHALHADTFTPIKNATRLKPGSINQIKKDMQGYEYLGSDNIYPRNTDKQLNIAKDTLFELIDTYLKTPFRSLAQTHQTVGIPLSGGLDSSLVTALASQFFQHIKTWSIGTEISNEFEFSQIVSEALGTEHHVKILTEADVINGVIEAIYHNEIFDGLSAEIQSGLFNVYRMATGNVNVMMTGYGSDLLFGGILKPGGKYPSPNSILCEQVYRTRWTGEFVSHGASHYGLQLSHPFWNNDLLSLCRNLNPDYKIKDNEVKNVLREYTEKLNLLPKEIVWRKKIGIHEGSSVNKSFANILGLHVDNYSHKTRFTYRVYKSFLENKLSLENATSDNLRKLIMD
ncbi:asparagine synthase family protein [Dickeya undicola]|uniref:Asparagine synthase n=1 Tax=Dickeya undicola TaxID=1577887 RepID=A0A3N0G7V6_9GAMM|nr:asparagine synthetase B family protein [Dickeya undicola]RNM08595.1 asparagine synthase [Dickeya undicola]RNM25019.1 asparagine synthase [Dickeya undicola]